MLNVTSHWFGGMVEAVTPKCSSWLLLSRNPTKSNEKKTYKMIACMKKRVYFFPVFHELQGNISLAPGHTYTKRHTKPTHGHTKQNLRPKNDR